MASKDHLHDETKMLEVGEHLRLLSSQFLASCFRPSHPSHEIISRPSGHRPMKQTLQSALYQEVAPFLDNGRISPDNYVNTRNSLHVSAVEKSI